MKKRQGDTLSTGHVLLTQLTEQTVSSRLDSTKKPEQRYHYEHLQKIFQDHVKDRFFSLWEMTGKKDGSHLGYIQFSSAPDNKNVEVDLSLCDFDQNERVAALALRRTAHWFFRKHRGEYFLETWLSPNLTAIRLLEKAGFERVFEADGFVRYEKSRQHLPLLALFMCVFTLAGFLLGYLSENFPLWISIGILAGILPGAFADKLLHKYREKKRK